MRQPQHLTLLLHSANGLPARLSQIARPLPGRHRWQTPGGARLRLSPMPQTADRFFRTLPSMIAAPTRAERLTAIAQHTATLSIIVPAGPTAARQMTEALGLLGDLHPMAVLHNGSKTVFSLSALMALPPALRELALVTRATRTSGTSGDCGLYIAAPHPGAGYDLLLAPSALTTPAQMMLALSAIDHLTTSGLLPDGAALPLPQSQLLPAGTRCTVLHGLSPQGTRRITLKISTATQTQLAA